MIEISSSASVTETEIIVKGLRQELKEWETRFFDVNQRKAGREDIKQHPEIEEKHKRYNQLRYPSAKTAAPSSPNASKKRPRPAILEPPPSSSTPKRRPSQTRPLHPSTIDPYDPPLSTHTSPIIHRTSIGPTPQKDGIVLGLFDAISPNPHSQTPSKPRMATSATKTIHATPSKPPSTEICKANLTNTGRRHHRSPLSTSKQSYLNQYLTPSASRVINSATPKSRSGVSKLRFDDTPAFLRRESQRAISFPGKENEQLENDLSWSPVAVRRAPMAVGKGLSALVKGLRDMEDERLDEDLEMLREMEGCGNPGIKSQQPKILVEDSQRPDMALGPDGGLDSGDDVLDVDEGKGRDGRPLKVWKKKGQKRTTRKVAMKPNVGKWQPEPVWEAGKDSEDEDETLVNETQMVDAGSRNSQQDSELDELGDEINEDENKKKCTSEGTSEGKKEGNSTKPKRKTSATAHANFRALKIKNKQSKAKRGGRFGRRK